MASVPFARLIVGGTLQASQGWSIGLSFVTAAQATDPQLYSWLNDIADDVHTWAQAQAGNIWGPSVKCATIGAYSYAAGSNRATHQASAPFTAVTGGNAKDLPPQCAVVASLLSGSPGRHNRGRIYIPFCSSNSLTDGQITNSSADAVATTTATLLTAIAGAPLAGGTGIPSVVGASASAGHATIGTVGVDTVVDTQRRRRDKIIGRHYAAAPL